MTTPKNRPTSMHPDEERIRKALADDSYSDDEVDEIGATVALAVLACVVPVIVAIFSAYMWWI